MSYNDCYNSDINILAMLDAIEQYVPFGFEAEDFFDQKLLSEIIKHTENIKYEDFFNFLEKTEFRKNYDIENLVLERFNCLRL